MNAMQSGAVDQGRISVEYRKFKSLLNRILSVPRATIVKREDEYQFHSALNPSRPGPKRASAIRRP